MLMHLHPLYISLEVKDNQNNSPQFWMIQIPYLKKTVFSEDLSFFDGLCTFRDLGCFKEPFFHELFKTVRGAG